MKRTRIGSFEVDTNKEYFVLSTPLRYMKQSEVRIYSYLDVLQEEAAQTNIDSELQRIYGEMDKYFCVAQIIEQLNTNSELTNAYYVFNAAVNSGVFDRVYSSLVDRNNEVNNIILDIINNSINYTVSDKDVLNTDLWRWWYENIIMCNYYTNPTTGAKTSEKPGKIVSVNGDVDFIGMFKQAAVSFCYSTVDESYLKASKTAVLKRKKENEVRSSLIACDIQLDSVTQSNYLKSGIAAATNGGNSVQFVNDLKRAAKQKQAKIGIAPEIIASIIMASLSFLGVFVKAIIDYRRDKLNNEATNSLNASPKYAPSESDFLNVDLDGDGRSDLSKLLLLGAAALAVYYFT